jgi:hypothetical protein
MDDDELKRIMKMAADVAAAVPEVLQEAAFNRALDELLGERDAGGQNQRRRLEGKATPRRGKKSRAKRKATERRKPVAPTLVKELNLRPKNQESFSDYVSKKPPKNDHERKLVSVYYLKRILEIEAVGAAHVYTCFRDQGWKVPPDLQTSLRLTANKKGWLDTSDSNNINVPVRGENHIEYEMNLEE